MLPVRCFLIEGIACRHPKIRFSAKMMNEKIAMGLSCFDTKVSITAMVIKVSIANQLNNCCHKGDWEGVAIS
jgi:hypothetical protein